MKKNIILWLGMVVFICVNSWQSHGADKIKTLHVVADVWCPYNCDPKSKHPGYVIEVLRAIFEPVGYQIKYDLIPWTRSIKGTRNGQYDMVVGAYRSDVPDFLFPKNSIGLSQNVLAKHKDSLWVYKGIDSFKEQYIAIVDGYSFGTELDEYLNSTSHNVMKLHGDDALKRALGMIKAGTLHGVLDDVNVLAYKIVFQGLENEIGLSNPIGEEKAVYVAFSPQKKVSSELIRIFDKGLIQLRSTGALDKILSRYQVEDWQ